MSVAVLVPWNGQGCEWRERAWQHVRAHYETAHPDWPLFVGECEGEWSKGTAVRRALEQCDADRLVIADADSLVPPDDLTAAVEALDVKVWGMPHRTVRRLNDEATRRFLAGEPFDRRMVARKVYTGVPTGGILVIRRDIYEATGGFDPGFLTWGGEDITYHRVLARLHGVGHKGRAELLHLWHPPAAPQVQIVGGNKELVRRWRVACRDLDSLAAFIDERRQAWPPSD